MVNWHKESQQELRDLPGLALGIVSAREELQNVELQLTALPSSCRDAPRVAGGEKNQEDHRLSLLARKEALLLQIEIAERRQQLIQAALEGVSAESREILQAVYVEGGRVEQLVDLCHVSRSRAFSLLRGALRQYALMRFAAV